MTEPVRSKGRMYDMLASGAFGNTTFQWFSLKKWNNDPESSRYQEWGVRTLSAGGPCRLYCPREEVEATVLNYQRAGHDCNISVMVDAVARVTLWADVYDSPTGIQVYGIENPGKGQSWRKLMPSEGRQYSGLTARMLLQKHLNPSSLADLEAVLEQWPSHVVELSALARCFGTVSGRNAVVWEVRTADGSYEKW